MQQKLFLFFLFYIVHLIVFSQITIASEEDPLDSGTFNYKVIHPENQRSSVGYFDLRMLPSKKQTVLIELSNPSEAKEVIVSVSLNSTKTNGNGILEYGTTTIEKDTSLKYVFEDIVKAPKKIKIQPGETVPLNIDISMPKEQFDGFISGGIELRVDPTAESKKAKEQQSGITNEYAYLIGLLLSETDKRIEPMLSFNKIYVDLSGHQKAVFINFSNTQSDFMKDMTVDVEIKKKNSAKVLYNTKKSGMRMAPNSKINFPVPLNGQILIPDDYIGHIVVSSGNYRWEWEEEFRVTKEETIQYKNQNVSLDNDREVNWLVVTMIVSGILIVLLLIFIVIHTINKKLKRKKQVRKRKKVRITRNK